MNTCKNLLDEYPIWPQLSGSSGQFASKPAERRRLIDHYYLGWVMPNGQRVQASRGVKFLVAKTERVKA